jgi:hypothetical protein
LPAELRIFTIQIEAHGNGSCTEAVEIARALRIDLWGAKNAPAGWIAKAQSLADRRKVPVKFFVANEEYGTFVDVPGLGTYSHTSDVLAPSGVDFGPSLAGKEAVSWEDFRQKRLAPLQKADGQWEAARPERGVTIRVRCRWDNTTQGLPKTPRVEVVDLAVDGQKVTPTLNAPRAKQGAYQDHYHSHHLAEPTPGKHTATATVRILATQAEFQHTIEFAV